MSKLKLEEDFIIRPTRPSDAEGINEIRRMRGAMETVMGIPSERISSSESFIASMDSSIHHFVAIEKNTGIIIGCAGLHTSKLGRTRNNGEIGIMIHTAYQSKGVGRALMDVLIDVADNFLMLHRVELDVYSDNEKAIRLYKSLGFEIEGEKREAVIKNGKYCNVYVMGRILAN
ncbi:MAG: GNAT family N-acetyltransferase [Filifactoraceae bacterium]